MYFSCLKQCIFPYFFMYSNIHILTSKWFFPKRLEEPFPHMTWRRFLYDNVASVHCHTVQKLGWRISLSVRYILIFSPLHLAVRQPSPTGNWSCYMTSNPPVSFKKKKNSPCRTRECWSHVTASWHVVHSSNVTLLSFFAIISKLTTANVDSACAGVRIIHNLID